MARKIRLGALVSGGGTNLQAIMDACESGGLAAVMAFVGSDNPDAFGLKRAAERGIPTFVVDYRAVIRSFRANPQGARAAAGFLDRGGACEADASCARTRTPGKWPCF